MIRLPPRSKLTVPRFPDTTLSPSDGMTYVALAVTPTVRPRRFNARFFVVDAAAISGDMADSHELLQLRWFSLPDARKLKIRPITELVLSEIEARLAEDALHDPARKAPAFTVRQGRRKIVYE